MRTTKTTKLRQERHPADVVPTGLWPSPIGWERFHGPRKAAICSPEPGRDAFHRVPNFSGEVWDAVERVPTKCEGRFMGRVAADRVRVDVLGSTKLSRRRCRVVGRAVRCPPLAGTKAFGFATTACPECARPAPVKIAQPFMAGAAVCKSRSPDRDERKAVVPDGTWFGGRRFNPALKGWAIIEAAAKEWLCSKATCQIIKNRL